MPRFVWCAPDCLSKTEQHGEKPEQSDPFLKKPGTLAMDRSLNFLWYQFTDIQKNKNKLTVQIWPSKFTFLWTTGWTVSKSPKYHNPTQCTALKQLIYDAWTILHINLHWKFAGNGNGQSRHTRLTTCLVFLHPVHLTCGSIHGEES